MTRLFFFALLAAAACSRLFAFLTSILHKRTHARTPCLLTSCMRKSSSLLRLPQNELPSRPLSPLHSEIRASQQRVDIKESLSLVSPTWHLMYFQVHPAILCTFRLPGLYVDYPPSTHEPRSRAQSHRSGCSPTAGFSSVEY